MTRRRGSARRLRRAPPPCTLPVPVADPECRSRWETPAHRGWGHLSWHGRFGQADVNLNARRGAAQRPWRLGPRFDGPRHDALDGSGRAATGTQAADMPRAALGAL